MKILLFTFALTLMASACDRNKGHEKDVNWQQNQQERRQEEQSREEQHYKDLIFKNLEEKHRGGLQNAGPT